jgi:hypothetical protein
MEMFFLQHATGVASTKLTPTALRTLSGGGTKIDTKELLKLREEEEEEEEDQASDPCSTPPLRGNLDENEREVLEYDPKIFTESQSAEMFSETDDDQQDYKPEEIMAILKMSKVRDPAAAAGGGGGGGGGVSKKKESDLVIDTAAENFTPLMKKRSFIGPGKGKVSEASSSCSSSPPQTLVHPRVAAISKQIQDAVRLSNEVSLDPLRIAPPSLLIPTPSLSSCSSYWTIS